MLEAQIGKSPNISYNTHIHELILYLKSIKIYLTQPHCIAQTGDEEVPWVSPRPSLWLLLGRPGHLLILPDVAVLLPPDLLCLWRHL